MKQAMYGLALYIFLMLPPVASLAESVMAIHMHMQMNLFVVVGVLFTPYLQQLCPKFFAKWNSNGIPGILLFLGVIIYWMVPRSMDEALISPAIEIFKFISLPFLAGVPLRDSWNKLGNISRIVTYIILSILFGFMAWLYIAAPTQLCNNYLIIEQKTLGWGFLFLAVSIFVYFIMTLVIDKSDYE